MPSFVETLRAAAAKLHSEAVDPWATALANIKGRNGNDGVERISTDAVFDQLNLRPLERTPEAGKRVKAIMCAMGWTWVRARHVRGTGAAGRVRGYARYTSK
jgi:hypothetical protein